MLPLAIALAVSAPALTSTGADQGMPPPINAPAATAAAVLVSGTPVRFMILKEINSRTARSGDRFKLRVHEPIYLNNAIVVPVGATAWGEIVSVEQNGAVGKAGKLGVRLLYLELPAGRIPLRGEYGDKGDGNGAGVVLAVVGFGLLGLLTGGDSARLKGGDTFTGYIDGPPLPLDAPSSAPIGTPVAAPQPTS